MRQKCRRQTDPRKTGDSHCRQRGKKGKCKKNNKAGLWGRKVLGLGRKEKERQGYRGNAPMVSPCEYSRRVYCSF